MVLGIFTTLALVQVFILQPLNMWGGSVALLAIAGLVLSGLIPRWLLLLAGVVYLYVQSIFVPDAELGWFWVANLAGFASLVLIAYQFQIRSTSWLQKALGVVVSLVAFFVIHNAVQWLQNRRELQLVELGWSLLVSVVLCTLIVLLVSRANLFTKGVEA